MTVQDREHLSVQLLIPWYVTGTLDEQDMQRLEEHLRDCEQCRREIDSEFDFARRYVDASPVPEDNEQRMEEGLGQLMNQLEKSPRPDGTINRRGWLTLAASLLIAVIASVWFLPREEAQYRTLTTAGEENGKLVFQVMFAPGTSERQVRQLLLDSGAHIVSGPSPQGVYRVAVPDESHKKVVTAFLNDRPEILLVEREVQ